MSFSSLLAGYAKSKVEPPVEKKSGPPPPKSHHLKPVLETARATATPIAASNQTGGSSELNLGILVMIIDDFPNELLWRLWLQQANTNVSNHVNTTSDGVLQESPQVRVWFHAKCPEKVRSPWVRERLVRGPTFKPEWGSIEITKVMAHMLHEALVDAPHINKFCFASESCIPIRSLDTTLQCLYAGHNASGTSTDDGSASAYRTNSAVQVYDFDSSWLCYTDVPNNGYAQQLQFDPLSRALPAGCVYKASQWVLLSRVHAQAVINLMQQVGDGNSGSGVTTAVVTTLQPLPPLSSALFGAFALVIKASDEMFFPSCLAVVGAISGTSEGNSADNSNSDTINTTDGTTTTTPTVTNSPTVVLRQVTYCDWTNNAKSPHEYTTFPTPLVSALTSGGANKKTLESLHIHPEQIHACFLRKIKFPIKYWNSRDSNNGGGDITAVVFSEVQEVFLKEWLTFVVSSGSSGSGGSSDSGGSSGSRGSTVDVYMQLALTLFNTIVSYPAPARAINKRALPAEEEHSGAGSGGAGNGGEDSRGSGYSHAYNENRGHGSSSGSGGGGGGSGGSGSSGGRYGRDNSRERGRSYKNQNNSNNDNGNNYNSGSRYNDNDGRYSDNQGYGNRANQGYSNKSPRY